MSDHEEGRAGGRTFDQVLSQGLEDLAADAPDRVTPPPEGRPGEQPGERHDRRRRAPVVLLGAAAAAAVVVAGVAVWTQAGGSGTDGPGGQGSASCAATLRVDGRKYVSAGDLKRIPVPGSRVGTARLPGGCDDSGGTAEHSDDPDYTRDAYLVPGVPAADAVFADDGIWVNAELTSLPAAVIEARTPQPCTLPDRSVVTGRLESVHPSTPPRVDGDVRAPFSASLSSTDPALTGGRWQSVIIRFRVPAGSDVPALKEMRGLLYRGEAARVLLGCSGSGYVSDNVQVADD
jgi:hypothetical protein